MIDLLPDEREIASVSGPTYSVVLTDWRVVSAGTVLGARAEQIIPLREVDSIEMGTSRNPFFLAAGVVFGFSFASVHEIVALVVGVAFVGLWWLRPQRGAKITSRSGWTVIVLRAARTNMEAVSQFVVAVQKALQGLGDGAAELAA